MNSILAGFRTVAALLGLATAGLVHAAGSVVTTDQVRAELLAHAPEGVSAGKPVWLALSIEHQRDWHTYWKNPGDSGLPTQLSWTLPAGVSAGEIAWPTPKKLPVGPLMNYGYDGRVLLPVPVTVPQGYSGSTLPVKLRAEWLVCKDVCIPQSGDFTLDLPTQAATAANGALFEAALRGQPKPAPDAKASARVDGDSLVVEAAALPVGWQGKAVDFLPEQANVIDNAAPAKGEWQGGVWRLRVPLSAMRSDSPDRMQAVLTAPGMESGLRVDFAVAGDWPAVQPLGTAAASPADAQPGALASPGSPLSPATARPVADASLALALGLAFIGGLLLNLMPCVFPVLSLKLYGFAQHHHDRRQLFAGGLAYTAGVVLSVLALAALLLALRAGGEQLGWGFQLQSPGFVAALALLFTLIGLNLLGVFELGHLLPSSLATARARHPLVDSALTGVIAVAVASPCTAPFMGASLGLALTLPAGPALAVFAALGLGMALPYLAVSAWPGLGRVMPRPGAWMARFRALMAFPMFATVLWLVWVLGQQTSIDGATALLGVLLAVAFAAWALGGAGFGRGGRIGFGALGVLLLAAALSWALPSWREPAPSPASSARAVDGWEPWSAQRTAEANAEGRAVFVDFTAAWCVTCQVNKRSTLGNPELLADFAQRGVLLMRADWTRRDAAIAAELGRLGRSGVPVYALYRPGEAMPQLLPEVLSVGVMREALASLPAPGAAIKAASRTVSPTP